MFDITTVKNTGRTHFKKGAPSAFLGRKHTDEAKKKMSEDKEGRCLNTGRTHFSKGCEPWNKGKTGVYSEEHRKAIGEFTRKRLLEKHHQKGKPRSKETVEKIRATLLKRFEGRDKKRADVYQNNIWRSLRLLVYKRDGFICQECGCKTSKDRKMHAHHIDYDPTNNDISNLITLCNVCHGKINYKKEDWIIRYRKKVTKIMQVIANKGVTI